MLVQHLPPGGALARAVHGHGWGDTEYLLAQLLDDVRRIPPAVYRAAGGKAKDPQPVERPKERRHHPDRLGDLGDRSAADAVAYLDSLSAQNHATT